MAAEDDRGERNRLDSMDLDEGADRQLEATGKRHACIELPLPEQDGAHHALSTDFRQITPGQRMRGHDAPDDAARPSMRDDGVAIPEGGDEIAER
jgi:hypothetical protein